MPFHNYKPLKNPVTLKRRYKAGLSEDDKFQVPLNNNLSFWIGMLSSFVDAMTMTPLLNITRKQRAGETLDFGGKRRWLWRGRLRQFVMWGPTLSIQSVVVGWGTANLRQYEKVNYALTPWEHIRATTYGGFASSLYSSPMEFFRAKQKISKKYLLEISRETVESFGVLGFYRNWGWVLARDTILCTGWMGILPAFHVALGDRYQWCEDHQSVVSLPFAFLVGALCSVPALAINSAKELALQYPKDVERASMQFHLKQLHAEQKLFIGLPTYALRMSIAFFLYDRVRWKIWDYHCNRKLRANPRLGHAALHPYDIQFGVHYSMRDSNDDVWRRFGG